MVSHGSRQVTYDYLSTEADAVYERLNRVYQIKEGSTVLLETRSSPLGRAGYRELGTTTAITRSAWTAETDDGYDRFGRVAQMKYDAGASLRAQLNFGYDAGSNRLYREDVGAATIPTTGEDLDEFYSHDALSRLTLFQLGDVTSGATPSMAVGDTGFRQAWVLDRLGNWGIFGEDVDGGTTYNAAGDTLQTRQHNIANEIDTDDDHTTTGNAIDDAPPGPATSDWVDPEYDAAGNMTKRVNPQSVSVTDHIVTYDAWNRVVKVEQDNTTPFLLASYAYDGLGRRIVKTTGFLGGNAVYDYYYSESWQAVEVRKNQSTDADPIEQFVYDPAYIDALAVRWYDANQDGSADKQFYLYDESFSVIALTDAAGGMLERYRYTRYGERFVMDADFAFKAGGTDHGQHRGFQGLLHDAETGLIENRNRMLDPTTGRFLQRDPHPGIYPDGMNAYAAYHVMWGGLDPSGKAWIPVLLHCGRVAGTRLAAPVTAWGTRLALRGRHARQLQQLQQRQTAALQRLQQCNKPSPKPPTPTPSSPRPIPDPRTGPIIPPIPPFIPGFGSDPATTSSPGTTTIPSPAPAPLPPLPPNLQPPDPLRAPVPCPTRNQQQQEDFEELFEYLRRSYDDPPYVPDFDPDIEPDKGERIVRCTWRRRLVGMPHEYMTRPTKCAKGMDSGRCCWLDWPGEGWELVTVDPPF